MISGQGLSMLDTTNVVFDLGNVPGQPSRYWGEADGKAGRGPNMKANGIDPTGWTSAKPINAILKGVV